MTDQFIYLVEKKFGSNLIRDCNGKVHGSQFHIHGASNNLQLIVYYEISLGEREEVKRKFGIFFFKQK